MVVLKKKNTSTSTCKNINVGPKNLFSEASETTENDFICILFPEIPVVVYEPLFYSTSKILHNFKPNIV